MVVSEQFKQYIISLIKDVPTEVFEGLFYIFCIVTITLIAFRGWKRGWRKVVVLLLIEYALLIFSSTVIYRKSVAGVGHSICPFWSYEAIKQGRDDLKAEIAMKSMTERKNFV